MARAASSTSASAQTMEASLPPSSAWKGFRCSAAMRARAMPVSTLPVRVSICTPGLAASSGPMRAPLPVSIWCAVGGSPHAWRISARRSSVSGQSLGGLPMTAFPAPSPAATLWA